MQGRGLGDFCHGGSVCTIDGVDSAWMQQPSAMGNSNETQKQAASPTNSTDKETTGAPNQNASKGDGDNQQRGTQSYPNVDDGGARYRIGASGQREYDPDNLNYDTSKNGDDHRIVILGTKIVPAAVQLAGFLPGERIFGSVVWGAKMDSAVFCGEKGSICVFPS